MLNSEKKNQNNLAHLKHWHFKEGHPAQVTSLDTLFAQVPKWEQRCSETLTVHRNRALLKLPAREGATSLADRPIFNRDLLTAFLLAGSLPGCFPFIKYSWPPLSMSPLLCQHSHPNVSVLPVAAVFLHIPTCQTREAA